MVNWIYSDIEVRGAANQQAAHSNAFPVMNRLFWVLHGIFADRLNTYAIALPKMREGEYRHVGHIMRIFSQNKDDLTFLIGALAQNESILGYVMFGKPKSVPQSFSGQWLEYRRFRVPNSKVHAQERRLKLLQVSEQWPYFQVKSQSESERHGERIAFSLHIARYAGQPSDHFHPNNYGLSSATRPFALPDI